MAEEAIRAAWMGAHGCQSGFEGPVGVRVCFSRQLAKSSPKGRAGSPDTSRPDLDNACKLVLDALNGVAFKDDRKVVSLEAHKLPRTPHGTGDSTYVTVTYHEEG